jgi:hypothetical protein
MGSEPSVVKVMTTRQTLIHGLVKNGGSAKHVQQHIDLIDPQSPRSLR